MPEEKKLPKWLIKTQHNSWEPEIFVSGIVLYALFQIPEYLEIFRHYFRREVWGNFTDIDGLVAVIITSIQWLIFGLILHLFFRGVWIGLVGLSYVFPHGIDNSKLKYKGKFEKRVRNIPHFANQIMRLEKISSSIFSVSYFVFMSILGAYSYIVVALIIPVYLIVFVSGIGFNEFEKNPVFASVLTGYSMTILIVGMVYMLDFLSLGLLKKVRFIARFYYPIYRIISTLTFSHLYRNVYYVLISNFRPWKVVIFNVLFIGSTFFCLTLIPPERVFRGISVNWNFMGPHRATIFRQIITDQCSNPTRITGPPSREISSMMTFFDFS